MRNIKSIEVGYLNITTHPHSPEMYYNRFIDAFNLDLVIPVRGDQVIRIGSYRLIENNNPLAGILGIIWKFTKIDPNGVWINTEQVKMASEADLKQIKIPENLKHNMTMFRFAFFPKKHRLSFETRYYDINFKKYKDISPRVVRSFFDRLLNYEDLLLEYPLASVTMIQDKDPIEKLYTYPIINKLEFEILLPNPDDQDEAEEEVFRRMKNRNAEKEKVSLTALPDSSINFDKQLKNQVSVARSYGFVTASGKNLENKKFDLDTSEHPEISVIDYNQEKEDIATKFLTHSKVKLNA